MQRINLLARSAGDSHNFNVLIMSSPKTFLLFIWACPFSTLCVHFTLVHLHRSYLTSLSSVTFSILWICTSWPRFLGAQVSPLVSSLAQGSLFWAPLSATYYIKLAQTTTIDLQIFIAAISVSLHHQSYSLKEFQFYSIRFPYSCP